MHNLKLTGLTDESCKMYELSIAVALILDNRNKKQLNRQVKLQLTLFEGLKKKLVPCYQTHGICLRRFVSIFQNSCRNHIIQLPVFPPRVE